MGSIRDAAYDVCKAVQTAPSIDKIRAALQNVHSSWFEYHVRRYEAQFLGYLLLDAGLDQLNAITAEPIPHLLEHERNALLGAHQQLVELNKRCLEPLHAVFPMFVQAADPYNRYWAVELPASEEPVTILTSEVMGQMVAAFHQHPAFRTVFDNAHSINSGFPPVSYAQLINRWLDKLLKSQSSDKMSNVSRLLITQPRDSLQRTSARWQTALLSLQSSLDSLNQLVYQATLSKKRPVLDDDIIIDAQINHGSVATTANVLYKFSPDQNILTHWTLVIIASQQLDMRLGRAADWHIESADNTAEVTLREVDGNLNVFGPLLREI